MGLSFQQPRIRVPAFQVLRYSSQELRRRQNRHASRVIRSFQRGMKGILNRLVVWASGSSVVSDDGRGTARVHDFQDGQPTIGRMIIRRLVTPVVIVFLLPVDLL